MHHADGHACRAWQLLVKFFFAQRDHLPSCAPELGLSPAQCHVLHLLEPARPMPMRELADMLACDASNVTGLVDRLEARRLVRRRPAPHDRRVKVLQLTPAGSRVRAGLLRRVAGGAHPLAKLSADEQRMLVSLLDRLVQDPDSR